MYIANSYMGNRRKEIDVSECELLSCILFCKEEK